jgi:two-component system response regulator NreC
MATDRILIADDHPLFVEGLRALLSIDNAQDVIGVASDGSDVLESIRVFEPQLVLLDINMPRLSGFEVLTRIKTAFPAVKVIMVSSYIESHVVAKAKSLGADGYFSKNATPEELKSGIDAVRKGRKYFPASTARQTSADEQPPELRTYQLSRREWEILLLIRDGLTSKQIAARLFLSRFTVEAHRKNIMHKLNVKNTAAMISLLHQSNVYKEY